MKENSFKTIVGEQTYTVWTDMLKRLVPEGRTHHLAPMIAGMIQYTYEIAYEQSSDDEITDSLVEVLSDIDEVFAPDGFDKRIVQAVHCLFDDAGVAYARRSSRGQGYSVAEEALMHFIHWHDMPWEY